MKRYLVELGDAQGDIVRTTLAKRSAIEVMQYIIERYHDHELITTVTIKELGPA